MDSIPRRRVLQAGAALGASALFAGRAPAQGGAKKFQGVTLNVSTFSAAYPKLLQQWLPEFEALTGAKVNFDTPSFPVYNQRADLELSTRGSGYDVVNVTFIYSSRWIGSGWLTPQWQIYGGYTYLDGTIVKAIAVGTLGKVPSNTPANTVTLWTTYDITPKFQVGGGVFYTSELFGDQGSAAVPQSALVPDWWRVDLMAAYKVTKQSTLQFNVYNVADKTYYGSAYSNWAVPASGRVFGLTYRVRFEPDDLPKSASAPIKAAALR